MNTNALKKTNKRLLTKKDFIEKIIEPHNIDKFKKLDVERSRFNVLRTATDIKKVAYYCIKDVRKNGLQNFDLANTTLADKLAVA